LSHNQSNWFFPSSSSSSSSSSSDTSDNLQGTSTCNIQWLGNTKSDGDFTVYRLVGRDGVQSGTCVPTFHTNRPASRNMQQLLCTVARCLLRRLHNVTTQRIVCFWRDSPQWARAYSCTRFLDHTQRRTIVSRTPLDEWSARRRDLYLTTQNTHNRQTSMPPVRFEPTISAGERPQTYALDRFRRWLLPLNGAVCNYKLPNLPFSLAADSQQTLQPRSAVCSTNT
jgi:hypothetical protein